MMTSTILVLSVTLTCILMTSRVVTQTASYDVAQLEQCAKLSHQLRNEIQQKSINLQLQLTNYLSVPNTKKTKILQGVAEASRVVAQAWEDLNEVATSIGKRYTSAIKAHKILTGYVSTMPTWSTVVFDHSIGYKNNTGELQFKRAGVYLIEFKAQSQNFSPYGVSYQDIKINAPDGTARYSFNLYTDWEVSPYFEMVKVEAGDTMKIKGNNYRTLPGISNQITVIYMGKHVPLGYITTLSPSATTQCSSWYCS